MRASQDARDEYLELFRSAHVTLTALNCNGNPLDPNPEVGPRHAQDVRDAIELAALLGVKRVVTLTPTSRSASRCTPHNVVYNPATLQRLVTEVNATHVGAEMDPSHLFWQGIDPIAALDRLGGRYTLSRWPEDSSWDFVAVGRGHDVAFWSEFLQALHKIDPDMAVNIEHEDQELDQMEGLRRAAETLLEAAGRSWAPIRAIRPAESSPDDPTGVTGP